MKRLLVSGAALLIAGLAAGVPNFGAAQSGVTWPTFHGNIGRNGSTTASGPTGNSVANQWSLPGPVDSSPAVDANGIGYVGDTELNKGKVFALDPSHPDTWKWSFATNGPVDSSPTLSPDGKTLYVGSGDGNLYALDTTNPTCPSGQTTNCTPTKIWSTNLNGPIHGSPLVTPDGGRIFINNANGTVYQLKASDGTETGWGHLFFPSIPGSLALSPDATTLYMATFNTYMYGIPVGGSPSATTTPFYLDGPAVSTPAIDAGGNIYVTTQKGSLMSFSPGSSTPRWTFTIPSHTPAESTPTIAGGQVIFGDDDQNIYALGQSNGSVNWQAHTGGSVRSSAAVGANNLIYVGSQDGNLYAFGLNGTLAWTKPIGAPVNSSPAIGPGGTLWVGAESNIVYRFKDVTTPPGTPVGATSTPVPTATTPAASPTPTSTLTAGAPTVTLKSQVKAGSKQTITITTTPNAVVHIRVNYPNGQHQSHNATANAGGVVSYSYTQGASKIKHNRFTATVIVTVNGQATTKTYKILFGNVDVSVEPNAQKVGKIVNVYVHTKVGKRAQATLQFPNGRVINMSPQKTGPHGFAHWRFKIPKGTTSDGNRKVTVYARVLGSPSWTAKTTFTIT